MHKVNPGPSSSLPVCLSASQHQKAQSACFRMSCPAMVTMCWVTERVLGP